MQIYIRMLHIKKTAFAYDRKALECPQSNKQKQSAPYGGLVQLILLTVINFPDLSIKKYVEMSRCRVLV